MIHDVAELLTNPIGRVTALWAVIATVLVWASLTFRDPPRFP